jgi:GNAT superfamily N-acetyltransferase
MNVEVTDNPSAEELKFLSDSLTAFNTGDVGSAGRRPLAVIVRDHSRAIIGGIWGHTAWGWLYVQWLWVDEMMRGRGIAARMLAEAEKEAMARGCHGAYIDTFSPIAQKVYERNGYKPFGSLPDFPKGRTRCFLCKPLSSA